MHLCPTHLDQGAVIKYELVSRVLRQSSALLSILIIEIWICNCKHTWSCLLNSCPDNPGARASRYKDKCSINPLPPPPWIYTCLTHFVPIQQKRPRTPKKTAATKKNQLWYYWRSQCIHILVRLFIDLIWLVFYLVLRKIWDPPPPHHGGIMVRGNQAVPRGNQIPGFLGDLST